MRCEAFGDSNSTLKLGILEIIMLGFEYLIKKNSIHFIQKNLFYAYLLLSKLFICLYIQFLQLLMLKKTKLKDSTVITKYSLEFLNHLTGTRYPKKIKIMCLFTLPRKSLRVLSLYFFFCFMLFVCCKLFFIQWSTHNRLLYYVLSFIYVLFSQFATLHFHFVFNTGSLSIFFK